MQGQLDLVRHSELVLGPYDRVTHSETLVSDPIGLGMHTDTHIRPDWSWNAYRTSVRPSKASSTLPELA